MLVASLTLLAQRTFESDSGVASDPFSFNWSLPILIDCRWDWTQIRRSRSK